MTRKQKYDRHGFLLSLCSKCACLPVNWWLFSKRKSECKNWSLLSIFPWIMQNWIHKIFILILLIYRVQFQYSCVVAHGHSIKAAFRLWMSVILSVWRVNQIGKWFCTFQMKTVRHKPATMRQGLSKSGGLSHRMPHSSIRAHHFVWWCGVHPSICPHSMFA